MSFVASAAVTVPLARAEAFARFVDFPSWRAWMPASFRPIKGPERALSQGDSLRMSLDNGAFKMPVFVRVHRLDEAREVLWGGGVPGVLVAAHSFFFDEDGGGTRIRSEETWTGVLTHVGPLAKRILAQAERVGEAQLAGFARHVAG